MSSANGTAPIETLELQYTRSEQGFSRKVSGPSGRRTSRVKGSRSLGRSDECSAFDKSWLQSVVWPTLDKARGTIKTADLFCGSGGLTLGAWEAARAQQLDFQVVFAADNEPASLSVYKKNFQPRYLAHGGLELLINGELGARASAQERELTKRVGNVDLLLAGPPCQGHSDLNNHTRRDDPRNSLLLRAVRFSELFSPSHIVIENVQGVRHDKNGVLGVAETRLNKLGYNVQTFLLDGAQVGLPQKRRRCFLIASRQPMADHAKFLSAHSTKSRNFDWACEDLQYIEGDTFNSSANVSAENQRRIRYLFKHDIHDLPDSQRPDCHRLRPHGYTSVYGRLHADRPAPTITTGFGSPGQGRFTHPHSERTLTPHEAARLQFFPDFFDFPITARKTLQRLIGNAVPPKLAFPVVLELLRHV